MRSYQFDQKFNLFKPMKDSGGDNEDIQKYAQIQLQKDAQRQAAIKEQLKLKYGISVLQPKRLDKKQENEMLSKLLSKKPEKQKQKNRKTVREDSSKVSIKERKSFTKERKTLNKESMLKESKVSLKSKEVNEAPEKDKTGQGQVRQGHFAKQVDLVLQILEYLLGEHMHQESTDEQFCNSNKTCYWWEIDEIKKQTQDTNLGDYLLKLPNPDGLAPQYLQLYPDLKQDGSVLLNLSKAMQIYNTLFDVEGTNQIQSDRQKMAFMLAFYVLTLPPKDQKVEESVTDFLSLYNYYKIIQNLSRKEYILVRSTSNLQEYEKILLRMTFIRMKENVEKKISGEGALGVSNEEFIAIKSQMYEYLSEKLQKMDKKEQKLAQIIQNQKKITEFLRTFPSFAFSILQWMLIYEGKQEKGKLFKGQFLNKIIVGENVTWVNQKSRPGDITTLLRHTILFRLVKRNHLFVRCFLSKDEQHIMMIVKTSEPVLENFAQRNKVTLQIELGASDLFSFQPVDHYLRPLRLHKYIRDHEFRQKYNLNLKKNSADDEETIKSIESQAINVFKKAEIMNEDELRSKIIIDQTVADIEYHWVSRKLNLDFLNERALTNKYNNETLSRQTWEAYYVYNKMIICFIRRAKSLYEVGKTDNPTERQRAQSLSREYLDELNNNIGMILRLMFVKAYYTANQIFVQHRDSKSFVPRIIQNLWIPNQKLKNIWSYFQISAPSGFSEYIKTKKTERIWRKFEINELKDRSKFFPSQRLIILNKIILSSLNIGKGLDNLYINDFYPLHDPYILKNIEILPYLNVIRNLERKKSKPIDTNTLKVDPKQLNHLYGLYQCPLTKGDFTKMSIEDKLAFSLRNFRDFSTESIRYYAGEKIALYFQFNKFLASNALPLVIVAFIIQILLWVETTQILADGSSSMTPFNDAIVFIWTIINVFWTTHTIQTWKYKEKQIAQKFGVSSLTQNQQKRVKFTGSFKRQFETDELNFEYVPFWQKTAKMLFAILLNLVFVLLVGLVILIIFILKSVFLQLGYTQSVVNQLPTVLITVAVLIFNYVYTYILRMVTIFENHKTIEQYESSLITKSFMVSFVTTFISLFIYAYFSEYLSSSFICEIKTTATNINITNCNYFVGYQLLTMVLFDVFFIVVWALKPFIMFKIREFWIKLNDKNNTKFAFSYFQNIDQFFEEQDKMDSFMYNDEIDNTWSEFMVIINIFTALAMFGPALPFVYVMMFLAGILRLHASKYSIVYLKKRTQPIKAKSIGLWLTIIEVVSYISVVTNISYMIFTRGVFTTDKPKIFFFIVIFFFLFKYYLGTQFSDGQNRMAKRNEIKTTSLLLEKGKQKHIKPQPVNTDIENVVYDESILKRNFKSLKEANVKAKES